MNTKPIIIAPSLLSADPLNLEDAVRKMEDSGADWLHVDVMDGSFVPNLTFGIHFIPALRKMSRLPLDVHLMIVNPDSVAAQYAAAGAYRVAFHIEASVHPHRTIQAIQSAGARAGLAVNPGTSLSALEPLLPYIDLINVMSVNPGFGGQTYIAQTDRRVALLADMIAVAKLSDQITIEVDGGINLETSKKVVSAGAGALVAGNYVFSSSDPAKAIASLRNLEN
jgi:ribulose-phosphate 3-epimerase